MRTLWTLSLLKLLELHAAEQSMTPFLDVLQDVCKLEVDVLVLVLHVYAQVLKVLGGAGEVQVASSPSIPRNDPLLFATEPLLPLVVHGFVCPLWDVSE